VHAPSPDPYLFPPPEQRPLLGSHCLCIDRLGGREEPPPLHGHVCHEAQIAFELGGIDAARSCVRLLFENKVMLSDQKETDKQLRAGVCLRFHLPCFHLNELSL
jgi:hypothetical protein